MLCCFSHVQFFLPYALYPTRLLCLWDSPGKNIGVGCHALLQGIFPIQGWNPHLLGPLHCRPGDSDGKESACNSGDPDSIDPTEKGLATYSSILAWKIPWTEEPGGLQSMGSQRVGHDWGTNTFTLLFLTTEPPGKPNLNTVDPFSSSSK